MKINYYTRNMNINKKITMFLLAFIFAGLSQVAAQSDLENGISAVNRGDYLNAVALLKRAVSKDSKSYDANLYYGIALYQTGSLKDAEKYIKKAVSIDNEKPEAYSSLGEIYT
ncbi:MAG: tetratricopeptide repeat protein, partial [Ignavibacteria bacterium]